MYIFLSVIVVLVVYLYRRKREGSLYHISGPKGWPIVGFVPHMKRGKEHEIFSELADTYGEIFKISIFGQSLVILNSARLIQEAFCLDKYKRFMNDRSTTFFGEYILSGGQGIAFARQAYGSFHGSMRKLLARGMHVYGEERKEFEDRVMAETMRLNDQLENCSEQNLEMVSVFRRSLTNLMSVLLGGHPIDDDDNDVNMFWDFDKAAEIILGTDVNLIMTTFPFLRFFPGKYKHFYNTMQQAKETIVRRYYIDKKKSYQPERIRGLVDFLISERLNADEEGREDSFTDEKIIALLLVVIGAGIMTTLASLSNLVLILLNHPEYQTKIQAELDRVVGRDRLPTLDDRQACVMIEAVILEAQRYITTTPLALPHLCKDGVDFEGYTIPPNSLVIPNLWYVHHRQDVWGDPWNFRPERWIDESGHLLPNDHVLRKNWLAFGTGRRQCPGESLSRSRIFLYVATLLQQWTFEAPPEHAVSCDPRLGHFSFELNCRPKPFMCRVIPRKR